MNQPTGSKILAFGHYQPSQVVTNEDLSKVIETNDAWIRDRVGIAARRIAGSESVADMATAAAGKALAASGLTAADIDQVIVATCSSIDRCPNVATRVAAKLGIMAPAAYDLNTACSGFCFRLYNFRFDGPECTQCRLFFCFHGIFHFSHYFLF